MNEAQIRKLQNKVAKEVGKKAVEKELQERAVLDKRTKEIISNMKELEVKYPNRGPCHCVWDGHIWMLHKGTLVRMSRLDEMQEVTQMMERVYTDSGMTGSGGSYYMFSEETFRENKEFMGWVSEHYAQIKMSLFKTKSENVHERLVHLGFIGSIGQEMSQKFPNRTMYDLKAGLQAMDMLLQDKGIELTTKGGI